MVTYELKPYVLDSCRFLNIRVEEHGNGAFYRLIFPPALQQEFQQTSIDVTFDKTNNPRLTYLTVESFITQKIAALVADQNDGVSTGVRNFHLEQLQSTLRKRFVPECQVEFKSGETIKSDNVMMWAKITLHGYFIDEYIKGFQYSMKTDRITTLPDEEFGFLNELEEELIQGMSEDRLNSILKSLMSASEQEAHSFYQTKRDEIEKLFQKEVGRINDYYKLLESENSVAETSRKRSAAEELALLKSERENLITQQRNKYTIDKESITIEPVAILYMRDQIESGTVQVRNQYGAVRRNVRADSKWMPVCNVSGNQEGPFTITSDNLVVLPVHSFPCNRCSELKDSRQKSDCSVCYESFCPNCITQSVLSKTPLCNEHVQQCQCCLQNVSVKEFHFCGTCHQYYCTECNRTDECVYCQSLAPVKGVTPQIEEALQVAQVSASKYEFYEKGNRVYILGKGLMFKTFFMCYDVREKRVLELQEFGMFNKKKAKKSL